MTEQEIKNGLQQIIDQTLAVNAYINDENLLIQKINDLPQENKKKLFNYYQERGTGYIVDVRRYVAERLQQGNITLHEVQEKIKEQKVKKPSAFRSYKKLYSILFPFITTTHEPIHTFLNQFLPKLLQDLNLENDAKQTYFDFQGARQQGSNRLWFAIYNKTQPDQSASKQIFGDFVNGTFSYGLYIHKTKQDFERVSIKDLSSFSYDDMLRQLQSAAASIKSDNLSSSTIREINLSGHQLYKISHGTFKTAAEAETLEEIKKRRWIVLHESTGYAHKGGDGDIFRDEMQIGDFVYITIGGNYLYNIARITSDCDYVAQELIDGDEGWLYREVEYLYEPLDNSLANLKEYRTKTYPSYQSALAVIESGAVMDEMNETLFVPHYSVRFIVTPTQTISNIINMPYQNTILYGPPGTGKTYKTILRAAEIIENSSFENRYDAAKELFKKLLGDQVEFITFHQNYSYEDFVAGLRPDTSPDNFQLRFKEHKGIFYKICKRARDNYNQHISGQTYIEPDFDEVLNEFLKPLAERDEPIQLSTIARNVSFKIYAIFDKNLGLERQTGGREHTLSLNTLKALYVGKREFNLQGLGIYYRPLLDKLKEIARGLRKETGRIELKNYVLIIDEINRANISRVFGELITLLEPDKRLGAKHELQLILPGLPDDEKFTVPKNLYIVGTMNTADKSIALLDIALRRRFRFEPLYPDSTIEGVQYPDILEKINEQVLAKKGADFLIGHSYFMKTADQEFNLTDKMNHEVIPLLNEYFYNQKGDIVKNIIAQAIAGKPMKVEYDLYKQLKFTMQT